MIREIEGLTATLNLLEDDVRDILTTWDDVDIGKLQFTSIEARNYSDLRWAISEIESIKKRLVRVGNTLTQKQCREIGRATWSNCEDEWYDFCQRSTHIDTRLVPNECLKGSKFMNNMEGY